MRAFLPATIIGLLLAAFPARASLVWTWSYSGTGAAASGTFTTASEPDANGFYLITGITGTADGAAINGLTPPGTAIPGNEAYPVDDLVRIATPQLTKSGFGFSTVSGEYANPFHLGAGYLVFLYNSPFTGGGTYEPPVNFSATVVPEPAAAALLLSGLPALLVMRRREAALRA